MWGVSKMIFQRHRICHHKLRTLQAPKSSWQLPSFVKMPHAPKAIGMKHSVCIYKLMPLLLVHFLFLRKPTLLPASAHLINFPGWTGNLVLKVPVTQNQYKRIGKDPIEHSLHHPAHKKGQLEGRYFWATRKQSQLSRRGRSCPVTWDETPKS